MAVFDILLVGGIFLFVISWNKQYKYAEGTKEYKNWYLIFELGWWMFLTGLLKYIL